MAWRPQWIVAFAFFLATLLGLFVDWGNGPVLLRAQSSGDPPGEGLDFQILTVHIDNTRHPAVTFKITDNEGRHLSLLDLDPSGEGTVRFTIAKLKVVDEESGRSEWASYIIAAIPGQPYTKDGMEVQPALVSAPQAVLDPVGTYASQGDGVFVYTFSTTLPADFDRNVTHRVGGQASRNGRRWVANDTFDFVPSGVPVMESRNLAETAACNQCHDPLSIHGGTRRDVKYCVTCHTPQTFDPESGNELDMGVMTHRIHRGSELPSVEEGEPYFVVGFRQRVFDYSHIAFPQDIRNCAKCHGEAFPYEVIPSNAACASCHDDVNVNTGENHGPGAYANEECLICHEPAGREFGISLAGAHTIPQLSTEVPGVNFEIVAVRDAEEGDERVDPGHHAQVIFNLADNAGVPIDPSAMAFLRVTLAGSTTEFSIQDYNGDGVKTPGEPLRGPPFTIPGENYLQQDARDAFPVGDGNYRITLNLPIPKDAHGTYAVGMEGYKCAAIRRLDQDRGGINCTPGNTEFNEIRDAGVSVVSYFPVTDVEPTPRRRVVDNVKCASCHDAFSKNFLVHGGIRNNPDEYCALCHNPSHDSLGRQPPPPVGETAITFPGDLKVMMHKIHTGEELANPYLLFGFGGQSVNVQDFLFPGDRRNCEKCHESETHLLRPDMRLPTIVREIASNKEVLNTFFTPPIKAACISCHDGESDLLGMSVATHADLFTVNPNSPNAVEQCAECHGEGALLAVSRMHERD